VDNVDRLKNLEENEEEKPNSPVNNPAMYGNVFLHSGEFTTTAVDFSIPGRGMDFAFVRTYCSQTLYSGPLGWGWDHIYNKRLLEMHEGDIIYFDGTGRRDRYKAQKKGEIITGYEVPEGWFTQLMKTEDGAFRLIFPDRTVEYFDNHGRLQKIKDRNNNYMEFYYDIAGQLTTVMDTMGRIINFEYYPLEFVDGTDGPESKIKLTAGRLKQITDFDRRKLEFKYNLQNGNLEDVKFKVDDAPLAPRTTKYTYTPEGGDLKLSHNLETITDPANTKLIHVYYASGQDKVDKYERGEASVHITLDETEPSVRDGENNLMYYTISNGRTKKIKEVGNSETTINVITEFTYNEDGLILNVKYPEGNSTTYTYYPPAGMTDRRAAGNLKSILENPDEDRTPGGSILNSTVFGYEGVYNQLESVSYPNGLTVTHSVPDANGNFKLTNTDGLISQQTFNQFGQLIFEIDPFGGSTIYRYHPEIMPGGVFSDPDKAGRPLVTEFEGGYLSSISSKHVQREFKEYDKRGNLLHYSEPKTGMNAEYTMTDYDEVKQEKITSKSSMSKIDYTADYVYLPNGLLDNKTITYKADGDPVTDTTSYTYTDRNMPWIITDSRRGTTTYTYDKNDNITGIVNGDETVGMKYTPRNLLKSISVGKSGEKSEYKFEYDGNGNIVAAIDPYDHRTTYGYDGYDRLMTVTDPLNNQTVISRLALGNELRIKQAVTGENALRESIRINDPLGRLKSYSVKVSDDTFETYNYTYVKIDGDDGGQEIKITDSLSRTWTVTKNKWGLVSKEEDPAGNITEYTYEEGTGNLKLKKETEVSTAGTTTHTTEYWYNDFNKVEKITETVGDPNNPETATTTFTYNARGELAGSVDAEGNSISHTYTDIPNGRKKSTTQHLSNGKKITTEFIYNDKNLLVEIIDAKGNSTEYAYDSQKRLKTVTYPDGSITSFDYTEVSENSTKFRVVKETQRTGTVVTSKYNANNKLVSRTIAPSADTVGSTWETYQYDALNRLSSAENDHSKVEYKYDPLNRITEEKLDGKAVTYEYKVIENRRQMLMKYPNQRAVTRSFDILDRLASIKEGTDNIAKMSYVGRSYRLLSKQFGNNAAVEYLYDLGRRMTHKTTKKQNGDLINQYVYGYNKVHMKTFEQRVHDNNLGDAYNYDAINRLRHVKFDAQDPTVFETQEFDKQKKYDFDSLSNITSITESKSDGTITGNIATKIPEGSVHSKLNQYEEFNTWNFYYDKNGNIIQKNSQHFTYDYRNQVISAKDNESTVKYKYDALGRRIQKDVTLAGNTKSTKFYYSGHQMIEERDSSENVLRQFIYGSGIDEILRMDKYGDSGRTPYYFHTNANGSVTAVTDANGNLIERVSYDSYGMPTFKDYQTDPLNPQTVSHSVIGNDLLFHGRRYDKETNLYYYRARYYDPTTGRFLQYDPLGYVDSMNLYQAFNMNGVNFLDPMGELTYHWNYLGVFDENRNKISGSKGVEEFKYGNLSDFLIRDYSGTQISQAGPLKDKNHTYLNAEYKNEDGKWYAEFTFSFTSFIFLSDGFNKEIHLRHEKERLLGFQVYFLETLHKLKQGEEKKYTSFEDCKKATDELIADVHPLKLKKAPDWWPGTSSVAAFFYDALTLLIPDETYHYRTWRIFGDLMDAAKIADDIRNFDEKFKINPIFNFNDYKYKDEGWSYDTSTMPISISLKRKRKRPNFNFESLNNLKK
jgi:RHS repeat-associated protein